MSDQEVAVGTDSNGDKTVNVAVRVPADLAREFERVAVSEERTVSAEIRRLMRLRVAEMIPPEQEDPGRQGREASSARVRAW